MLGLTLAFLAYALIEGSGRGWASPPIIGALACAIFSAAGFAWWEHRSHSRVIPAALLARPRFLATSAAGFLLNFGLYAVFFLLGLLLQTERGATPTEAGFQILPIMAVFVVGNFLYTRLPLTPSTPRWSAAIGLGIGAIGALALIAIGSWTPYWLLVTVLVVADLGIGVAVPALTVALMTAAGAEYAGFGSAAFNATRQIGSLIGIAITGTLIATTGDWYTAARLTFLLAGIAYAAAAALSATGRATRGRDDRRRLYRDQSGRRGCP